MDKYITVHLTVKIKDTEANRRRLKAQNTENTAQLMAELLNVSPSALLVIEEHAFTPRGRELTK